MADALQDAFFITGHRYEMLHPFQIVSILSVLQFVHATGKVQQNERTLSLHILHI